MQALIEERDRLKVRVSELERLLNTPETENFLKGVKLESAHQVGRWGQAHDRCKSASDWFWLVGYLAGKALNADRAGDVEKTKHHCISTGAALANWHNSITTPTLEE